MSPIRPRVVYLSVSAHSEWRDSIREAYARDTRVRFVGPCEDHGLSDAMGAPGDVKPGHKLRIMQMIGKSDLLFAYVPDDRVRGFNVMLEIGVARAWGRRILFVNEARSLDEEVACVRPYVDESFDRLDVGLERFAEILSEPIRPPEPAGSCIPMPNGETLHRIYLTGSSDAGWIERVRSRYRENRSVRLVVEGALDALAACDVILACRTDAAGRLFHLCLAVGFGAALAKRVLFVNEGDHYSHAYDYLKPFADGTFTTLDEALRYLDYAVGIEHRLRAEEGR